MVSSRVKHSRMTNCGHSEVGDELRGERQGIHMVPRSEREGNAVRVMVRRGWKM